MFRKLLNTIAPIYRPHRRTHGECQYQNVPSNFSCWKVAKSEELWEISDITSIALKQIEPAKPLYCASNNLKCNSLLGSSSHFLAAKRARRVYLTSSVCWVRLVTVSSNQCFFGSVFCAAIAHDVNMADLHEVPPTSLWFWRDWMMSMLFRRACKSNCGAAWPWKFGLRGPVHVMSRDFSQFVRKRFEQFQNTQVDADWSKWLSLAPRQWTYLYVGTPKQEDLQNKTGLLTWNTDHSSSNYTHWIYLDNKRPMTCWALNNIPGTLPSW